MVFPAVTKIMTDYKYLFIIRCKIDKEFEPKFIPSFITNETVGYLVKSIEDVVDIIKEIFLVWRYNFHSNPSEHIQKANVEYMEQIIQKTQDLKIFPYFEFKVGNSEISSGNIDCWFKVYAMRDEFINLLDLIYEENKPELINKQIYLHRIIPFIIYKDINPNRLRVHITQNPEYITKGINQTFLLTKEIYELGFYASQFEKLGLVIKNSQHFINLIKSGNSFMLTHDDFKSKNELLYAHIYFLTPINESVLSVQQNLYYLKTDYFVKICDKLFYPTTVQSSIKHKLTSFL